MSDFTGTTLKFDISELKNGINQANALIKTNNSYWQANAAAMGDWTNTAGGLAERNKSLNAQLEQQKKKVENQTKIVEDYTAAFGENSETTQQQIQILNSYKAALSRTENEIKKNAAKIDELTEAERQAGLTAKELKAQNEALKKTYAEQQKAVSETEKQINKLVTAEGEHGTELTALRRKLAEQKQVLADTESKLGDYAEKTADAKKETGLFSKALKGISGAAKVAAGAVAAVAGAVTGAVGGMIGLSESTRDSRAMFAKLENNATLAGKSYDNLTDNLKNVVAVTGDLEAGFEGMNMLSNLKGTDKEITRIADALAGASAKFDGLKFEGLAEGLQETVATGAAVGPFAELIERTGGDLEAFNAQLAGAANEAGRTQIAMDWLANSGLTTVAASFRENNKALVEARQAEIDLQIATNELGNVTEPLAGKIKGMAAGFLSSLIPSLQSTGEAFTNLINGVAGSDKQLAYNLGVLVGTAARVLKGWWNTAKPALETLFTDVIPYLAGKLIAKIPAAIADIGTALYNAAPDIISSISNGLAAGFESLAEEVENPLLKSALEGVTNAFKWISDNAQLVTDGIILITGAIAGFKIIQTVTSWISAAKTAFGLLNTVMAANPIGLVVTAVGALVAAFALLYKNNEDFRAFIDGLWEKIKDFGKNLWDWATKDIPAWFAKVLDGVKDLPAALKNKFDEAVQKAADFGKDLYEAGKDALTQTVNGFLEKAGTISESVKDVGRRMIEGVWNGINSAKDWLFGKIGEIFGKDGFIIGGIKKLLGIHSPAKETEPIGEYFMKGFEVGFSGEAANAEKITNEAFEKLAEIPAKVFSGVSTPSFLAAAGTTGAANSTGDFSAYESELQKLDANIRKVTDDIAAMNAARLQAWRRGEDTSYFDTVLENASAKLDELKKKRDELLAPPATPTFADSLLSSFEGLSGQLQGVLASAISGAISGDTSALNNSLSGVGDFLVNGLQSFIAAKMPVLGGFIGSLIGGIWQGIKGLFKKDEKESIEEHKLQARTLSADYAKATIEGYQDVVRRSRANIKQDLGKDIAESMAKVILPNSENAAPQKVINYTQNNYSPKALSAKEIYRNNNRAINLLAAGARI